MAGRAKARAVFLSALALLCLCGIVTYISFINFRESERWVTHTQEVRGTLGDLESAINRASRTRMAYLISSDPSELSAYRQAVPQISEEIRRLQELTKDNLAEVEHCRNYAAITNERMRVGEALISQKQQGKAIELVPVQQQNIEFASQSAAIAEGIRSEEGRLLQQRIATAHRSYTLTRAVVILSFALALLLLYLHYYWLTTELRAREQAELVARNAYVHEAALRQGEERFRLFIEAVQDYAIFMLDNGGHISSWNQGAERLNGYKTSEIIGRHFSVFYPEEDIRAQKPERELEVATREGRIEDEGWRVRKNGSRFWANVIITALRDDQGRLIGFAKITRDFTERMRTQEALRERNEELAKEISERKVAEEKLAISAKSLRELSFHLLRTQDEERKRIGRDLHDSLGQYLAALKMNLDTLQISLIENPANGAGEQLDRCVRLAEDSLSEMRTISYLLYPPMLEEVGLTSAIRWYLDGFSKRSQIETTFEVSPGFGRIAPELELALFRILQEGLTNVHRHSGSKTANVRLFQADGMAILEVEDRGKGLPLKILQQANDEWLASAGVGLRGMTERMRQFGGNLEIASTANRTVVTASVPTATLKQATTKPVW
jgi:PAS domain S-box-containing protein